jgi:hypothetical protein
MSMTIPNYVSSNIFKTYLLHSFADRNGAGQTSNSVGVWRNTAAINNIYVTFGGSMTAGTTVTIYGIKAGA